MVRTPVQRPFLLGCALALLAGSAWPGPETGQAAPGPSVAPAAPSPTSDRPDRVFVFGGADASEPYEYLDARKQPQGLNVDLVRALGRISGRRIEFRLGRWSDLRKDLEAGRIDLMNMGYSEDRATRFDFLDETWNVRLAVFFSPGRAAFPESLDALASERVAVQDGAASHDLFLNMPASRRPVLVVARDPRAAIEELLAGRATALAGNELVLRTALARMGLALEHKFIAQTAPYRLATGRGRGGGDGLDLSGPPEAA